MEKMAQKLANLIKVKTIVTLVVTTVFAVLSLRGMISADNVMLSACKRSEDGTGLILRLYETDGKQTPVTVSGDLVAVPLEATFSPWSMRTYFLADGAKAWKEVLITEYDIS